MIAIEHELTEQLNEIDIVKDFADAKAKKKSFIHTSIHVILVIIIFSLNSGYKKSFKFFFFS